MQKLQLTLASFIDALQLIVKYLVCLVFIHQVLRLCVQSTQAVN